MSEMNTHKSNAGSLKISQGVVESIVRYAASDVEGVASMAPMSVSLSGWFWEKKTIKPVSVAIKEGVAVIDLRICVRDGINVSTVSKKVQTAVKEAVQNMAGIVVSRVNVCVAGIVFSKEAAI